MSIRRMLDEGDIVSSSQIYSLRELNVTLSTPVQVAKWKNCRLPDLSEDVDGKFLWYPQVARLSNGELLAQIRLGGDSWQADIQCPIGFSWSGDGGKTWSELLVTSKHNGYGSLILPSGDLMILPYLLAPASHGMVGPCNLIPHGKREVRFVEKAVEVTGFLRKTVADTTMGIEREGFTFGGFVFDGRPVRTRDGWLTTVYGKYDGDVDKKCTLHAVASTDGVKWEIRSTIAAADNALGQHRWGNSEAEICRLPDNRLMCVYRIDNEPYGRSFSSDEGFTWTQPTPMPLGVGTVEPRLAVTGTGVVTLCGGRPRYYLWFNADGTGKDWQGIDIFTHHNALAGPDQVRFGGYRFDGCSAYGSVIPLDDTQVLLIYDCFTDDEFGIYVVHAAIEKTS
ncbi:MAG: sialidase family protein [Armatimonadota bacterium]